MSLVFLKNDDQSRDTSTAAQDQHLLPYRWSNYFTNPIKIKKNSQVAYIKSSFNVIDNGEVSASTIYQLSGMPELNPTIPIHLPESSNENWKQYLFNVARLLNQYSNNDTYTNNTSAVSVYQGINQRQFDYGWNLLLREDDKVDITCVPKPAQDVYNQDFNNGSLSNFDTTGVDDVDIQNFAISSPLYSNGNPSLLYNNQYLNIPPGQDGTRMTNMGVIQLPKNVDVPPLFFGGVGFYNTGYSASQSAVGGNQLPSFGFGNLPNFNEKVPSWKWGFCGMSYTNTPIKQYCGGQPATANGGGHNLPNNGYVIKGFRNYPQEFADTSFPFPLSGTGLVGGCCIANQSFGVQSLNLINSYYPQPDPVRGYMENVDLNNSSNDIKPFDATCRYLLGCDIFAAGGRLDLSVKVLTPEGAVGGGGTLINSSYTEVAPGIVINLLELANAWTTTINCGTGLTAGRRASQLFFRFRWTSPYTMAVDYTLSVDGFVGTYDPETDIIRNPVPEPFVSVSNPDPRDRWITLYDMNQPAPYDNDAYFIPKYIGDVGLVEYNFTNLNYAAKKGFFNSKKSYRYAENLADFVPGADEFNSLPTAFEFMKGQYGNSTLLARSQIPARNSVKLGTLTPEIFKVLDGIPETQLNLVMNPISDLGQLDLVQDWYGNPMFQSDTPNTQFGKQIGFLDGVLVLNNNPTAIPAEIWEAFESNGTNTISLDEAVFSNHIQLTNLPIQSQNGVKSTQNKTIAVVSTLCVDGGARHLNDKLVYCDSAHLLNWIDLNNYNDIELQKIDVLITNDDNTESTSLIGRTDIVIIFRQNPQPLERIQPIRRNPNTQVFFNSNN